MLSRPAQVARLRKVAMAALDRYPIEVSRVRLLDHGHNATFRVDAVDGTRYALRVNVGSSSTPGHIDGELAWLTALAAETDLIVPVPQSTRGGSRRTSIRFEPLGRDLDVVVMSWLPGRVLDEPSVESLRALGATMATLHDHADGWAVPAGVDWPSATDVLVGDERRLDGDHPILTPDVRSVVDAALIDAQSHLDELWAGRTGRPIHGDLHTGNVKWFRRRLAVFDFDDVLMGVPALDLGISAYYLSGNETPVPFDALLDGYSDVRPLPTYTDRQFHAMLAGRNLLLLNEVLGHPNADVARHLGQYARNTAVKLRAYLETGVYRHDVDGVQRIDW